MTTAPLILLAINENGTGFLVHGPDGGITEKPFRVPGDPLKFLAWRSTHAGATHDPLQSADPL